MTTVATRVGRALDGWRGVVVAALGGAAAGLAHPPYGLVPGVFGFGAVLLALDAAPSRRRLLAGFLRGWAAGFGYLAISTSWIGEPFLIDAAAHAWQAPFALALTPGLIGLIWGVGGLAYVALRGGGRSDVLLFASVFATVEWVRGHVFTGFPWDLPGELWRAGSPLSQGAALIGAYGLGWITLLIGASPASLVRSGLAEDPSPAGEVAATPTEGARATVDMFPPVLALALVGALGFWGEARTTSGPVGPVFRLVQPGLPEPPAWSPAVVDRAIEAYTRMTRTPARPTPAVVIWPEGAIQDSFNDYLAVDAPSRAGITEALRPGQTLLAGGVMIDPAADGGGAPRYFNTLLALRRSARGLVVEARYDKHHLVPFGEFMPLARWLEPLGLRKLVSVPADFTPGPPSRPITVAGMSLQVLICYEALFPEIAEGDGRARPRALINVSDDAWFGRRAGPWQHFNLASYRAIEQGLPMARVTPTGVSGMIDAFGRPASRLLPPGASGVLDVALPPAIAPPLYVRWREGPFVILVLAGLVPWAWRLRRRT